MPASKECSCNNQVVSFHGDLVIHECKGCGAIEMKTSALKMAGARYPLAVEESSEE